MTPPEWKDLTYSHVGSTDSLARVLGDFCGVLGLRLEMPATEMARRPSGALGGATNPAGFLDRLASRHGFSWFVYAGTLYVDAGRHLAAHRLELRGDSASGIKQALVGLGLFEPRFGWGEPDERSSVVLLSGPPSYVGLVRDVVSKFTRDPPQQAQVMLFRLNHAPVADYEVIVRDKVATQPGVATVLRGLLGDPAGRDVRSARSALDGFKAPVQDPAKPGSDAAALLRRSTGNGALSIEPFPAINAVLIRDSLDRRPLYEQLISELDKPLQQIEILATVIDAQAGTLREWALDLSLGGRRWGAQSRMLGAAVSSSEPTITLWGASALELRLRALESDGRAQVVARPSVLALDNRGAILDLSTTAYLRLVGERAVDAKPITVGNLLYVTPRVVPGDGESSVLLDINIEDGTISANESFPQATRNTITTQAVLGLGQALVIGGFQQDQSDARHAQVPGLSSIPLVGALFKGTANQHSHRERIYMISARIVAPQGVTAAVAN